MKNSFMWIRFFVALFLGFVLTGCAAQVDAPADESSVVDHVPASPSVVSPVLPPASPSVVVDPCERVHEDISGVWHVGDDGLADQPGQGTCYACPSGVTHGCVDTGNLIQVQTAYPNEIISKEEHIVCCY